MKIKKFIINPFQINCYIYYDEVSREGVIIDPGAYNKNEEDEIVKFIENENIRLLYSLNTHGHIDHILGNKFAVNIFNIPQLIHKDDLFLLENAKIHGKLFGLNIEDVPAPDDFITDNLVISIGNTDIRFMHTPGHSPGGVCIVDHTNKVIFSGDTIFRDSIGRTDLAGGDIEILLESIHSKLFCQCDDDYRIYPGHMEETTIGMEKKNNPFLR
jgi:glyoxylase-like metal-dependent hydrolase (beta-lactamase superfamily II)